MLPLLTGTRHVHDQRPPDYPWALNEDSAQAQGLVGFWPLGYEHLERDGKSTYDLTNTGTTLSSNDGGLCRNFVSTSSQYLRVATTPVTAVPITMGIWCLPADATNSQDVFCVDRLTVSTDAFRLNLGGATAGDPVRAIATQAASSEVAVTTTGFSLYVPCHAAAVFSGNASRSAFINGGSVGSNSTTKTPASVDGVTIGRLSAPSPGTYYKGQAWHACLWNRALSAAEIYALHQPDTRWELYYPLGRKTWSFKPAAAATGGSSIFRSPIIRACNV